jgi:hypothetical protein
LGHRQCAKPCNKCYKCYCWINSGVGFSGFITYLTTLIVNVIPWPRMRIQVREQLMPHLPHSQLAKASPYSDDPMPQATPNTRNWYLILKIEALPVGFKPNCIPKHINWQCFLAIAQPKTNTPQLQDVRRLDVSMKDLLSAAQREASHITRYLPFETHLLMVSTMINLGTYPFGTSFETYH